MISVSSPKEIEFSEFQHSVQKLLQTKGHPWLILWKGNPTKIFLDYADFLELLQAIEEKSDDLFADLLLASQSSLDFWDNPLDDEDWNNASPEGLIPERKQTPPPATTQRQS